MQFCEDSIHFTFFNFICFPNETEVKASKARKSCDDDPVFSLQSCKSLSTHWLLFLFAKQKCLPSIAEGKIKRRFEEKTTLIILIAMTAARKGHGNTLNDHQDFCPQALTSTNLTHEKSKHHKMPL